MEILADVVDKLQKLSGLKHCWLIFHFTYARAYFGFSWSGISSLSNNLRIDPLLYVACSCHICLLLSLIIYLLGFLPKQKWKDTYPNDYRLVHLFSTHLKCHVYHLLSCPFLGGGFRCLPPTTLFTFLWFCDQKASPPPFFPSSSLSYSCAFSVISES